MNLYERNAELRDWTNVGTGDGKVTTRFPPSDFKCPDCQKLMLEDNWPPNYGGGSVGASFGGQTFWTHSYSQKCICLPCKTAVRVSVKASSNEPKSVVFSDRVPLVQREDGIWLTPHDVWREKYKTENGQYPNVAYG